MMHTILRLFTFETWVYIMSISLQVAGAICLIMNYWGNVKEKVIITYYVGGEIPKAQDNDMVLLRKERLQSCAKDIYINRFFCQRKMAKSTKSSMQNALLFHKFVL